MTGLDGAAATAAAGPGAAYRDHSLGVAARVARVRRWAALRWSLQAA